MIRFIKRQILLVAVLLSTGISANAQFYELTNQVTRLVSPALSGGFNYKGYVEASYLRGVGDDRLDVVDFSTTQGFKYSSWCFMGVGAGIDLMIPNLDYRHHEDVQVMMPLYVDFRFTFGNPSRVGVSLDLRLGAAFTFDDFPTNYGYIYEDEAFYFRPSLYFRIPINKNNSKQALNLGFTYQLLVADYYGYSYWDNNKAFNNLGATIGFEW